MATQGLTLILIAPGRIQCQVLDHFQTAGRLSHINDRSEVSFSINPDDMIEMREEGDIPAGCNVYEMGANMQRRLGGEYKVQVDTTSSPSVIELRYQG